MKKILSYALIASLTILTLTGCGKAQSESESSQFGEVTFDNPTDITFVLDWTPNTNHTGVYVADKLGYFEEAGLNVTIVQPPEDGAKMMVATGQAQFGVDFQDYLADAFALEEPMPITAVAAIIQHNTSGIISRVESGITKPSEMAGHTYATWELPIEQAMLKKLIEDDGSSFDDVELLPTYVDNVVSALNSGIESVWIYYGWDGIRTAISGVDTNFINFADVDETFDYYSPVIIGNNSYLKNHPDTAKAFLAAVKKGYEYSIENPEEAGKILLEAVPELDSVLVNASQHYLAEHYQADATQWGIFDAERWNRFYAWINENNLTENDIPLDYGFTNEYIEE